MQPSNQQLRLNNDIEELSWEDDQLFVVTQAQQGSKSHKPTQSSYNTDQFPLDTGRQMAAIKDLPSQEVCTSHGDERLPDFPALVPMVGDEMLGWLDDTLDHEAALALQRNMRALPVISSHPVQSTVRTDFPPSYGQEAAFRENLESVARLSGSPTPNKRLKLSAEIDMPPMASADPTLTRGLVQTGAYQLENPHCMATTSLHPAQEASFSPSLGDRVAFEGSPIEPMQRPPGWIHSLNSQAARTISSASDMESALLESSEHTQMAASCGSGSGPDKGQRSGQTCGMRKDVVADVDSESEASYDDAMTSKKPRQAQSGSTRRARAAETHNESERKRRGRINEKLKALQELIPNANKTDKASILSEAIDYLKKLRLQLQIMCCRSGMNISPFLISQGVHHLQMPPMGTGSTFGMEAGPGFGVSGATPTGFLGLPVISSVESSAQIGCPESSAQPHAMQSLPVISSSVPQCTLPSTGLPFGFGATNGSHPASLHQPFPV